MGACTKTSNVQCGTCRSCSNKRHYVLPSSMCNGFSPYVSSGAQTCVQCRTDRACSSSSSSGDGTGSFYTLFDCYSGEISYDTTVCVSRQLYKDPLSFRCDAGYYLDARNPNRDYSDTTFDGTVYLNPADNSYLADVVDALGGTISIFRTESSYSPLVPVSEGVNDEGSSVRKGVKEAAPAIRIWPDKALPYTYNVQMYVMPYPQQNASSPLVVRNSTFVHAAMASAPGSYRHGVDKAILSATWSFDGAAFFVVWMDGTISKIVVKPLVLL